MQWLRYSERRTITSRPMPFKKPLAILLACTLVLPAGPAHANEQMVELVSNGWYQTYRLPDDVEQVELAQQLSGDCSFNRNWGYDIGRKDLWVTNGCGGRFRLVTRAGSQTSGGDNTGAWIAGAAVAAIAGAVILANRHDRDKDRDDGRYPDYPPQQGPAPWRGQEIRGQNGLCLDVAGGLRAGNALNVYQCTGAENQRFAWTRQGEMRVGDLCLDVAQGSTRQGARVIAWQCRNQPNQQWEWSGGQIRSLYTGMCLDIEGGRARPGQPVVMWPCAGSSNQRWR